MEVKNINSNIEVPKKIIVYSFLNSWTYPYTKDIPIYLVNPETIDKITPPERRKGIDPEFKNNIKELLENFINEMFEKRDWYDIDNAIEKIYDRISEFLRPFDVLGVFVAEKLPSDLNLEVRTPAIFICPERIEKSSIKLSKQLNLSKNIIFKHIFRSVVIHEQTHAYSYKFSRGVSYYKYPKYYYIRIIEEFLAQYVAYSYLNSLGKFIFSNFSETQPLEYQTWKAYPSSRLLSSYFLKMFTKLYKYNRIMVWHIPIPLDELFYEYILTLKILIHEYEYWRWLRRYIMLSEGFLKIFAILLLYEV